VRDALEHARSVKVRRAALEALAMIADPADHAIFLQNLPTKTTWFVRRPRRAWAG